MREPESYKTLCATIFIFSQRCSQHKKIVMSATQKKPLQPSHKATKPSHLKYRDNKRKATKAIGSG